MCPPIHRSVDASTYVHIRTKLCNYLLSSQFSLKDIPYTEDYHWLYTIYTRIESVVNLLLSCCNNQHCLHKHPVYTAHTINALILLATLLEQFRRRMASYAVLQLFSLLVLVSSSFAYPSRETASSNSIFSNLIALLRSQFQTSKIAVCILKVYMQMCSSHPI